MGQIRIHLSKEGLEAVHLASGTSEEEAFLFQLYSELREDLESLGERCRTLAVQYGSQPVEKRAD